MGLLFRVEVLRYLPDDRIREGVLGSSRNGRRASQVCTGKTIPRVNVGVEACLQVLQVQREVENVYYARCAGNGVGGDRCAVVAASGDAECSGRGCCSGDGRDKGTAIAACNRAG